MRIIALGQQKGGVGKSAASINLAGQAEASGQKAAVIDLDAEQGTTIKWGSRRNGKDAPIIKAADVNTLQPTLDALKANGVKWVFLDLPGRAAHIAAAGLKAADLVIIPCRPLDVDIEASLDTVARVKRGDKRYTYLINIAPGQADKKRAKQVASFLRAAGHPVAETIIVQRIIVPDALAQGMTIDEAAPNSESATEYRELFDWLNKEVKDRP